MRTRSLLLSLLCAVLALAMCPVPAGADEPAVTISGSKAATNVGAIVTGVTGSTTYVWTVDGVVTPSVDLVGKPIDPSRLLLLEEYIGKPVVVTATVKPKGGGPAVVLVSAPVVPTAGRVRPGVVTIPGPLVGGQPATAVLEWGYPTKGVTYAYQWFLDRQPISQATGASFTPSKEMEGQYLRVSITTSKPGWESATTDMSEPAYIMSSQITAEPVIDGSLNVNGRARIALAQSYGCPCQQAVEWLIDGRVVAKGESLILKQDWVGKRISGRVTLTAKQMRPATVTTPELRVLPGETSGSRLPVGASAPGWLMKAPVRDVGAGTYQSVRWYRGDELFLAGPERTYRLQAEDVGHKVRAVVKVSNGHASGSYAYETAEDVALSVYTTPGSHNVNGRWWRTECEQYSQTIRCRAEVVATQVVKVNGRWAQRTGYVFNNLTYLPLASGTWGKNPLARDGEWIDAAGRQWRTECDTPATGRGACRTYIRSNAQEKWVFNNLVYTR